LTFAALPFYVRRPYEKEIAVKNIWLGSIVLLVVLVARPVLADEAPFGQGARGAIAVERLFGYTHLSTTTSLPGATSTSRSQDVVTLLGGASGGYTRPRLGGDLFVGSLISVGASAFFGLISPDSGSQWVLQINPRIGALVSASRSVALWPRVGFDYVRSSSSSSSLSGQTGPTLTSSRYSLTLEAPLLIAAAARVAVVITPMVEVGLGGSNELKNAVMTSTTDQKMTELGLLLGFLMFL
jgi:hypothetical protein